jgi:hypothetical protein
MRRGRVLRGRSFGAAAIGVALVLTISGCAGSSAPEATPLALRLVDIQSGTIRVGLNQVVLLDIGSQRASYTAQIADGTVVAVVAHRDETDGRFEPELVPLRVGVTQVALTSSIPGQSVVGFKVIVSETTPASRWTG